MEISLDINGEIKQFQCRMLCGADGAHSWVRRTFKMGRPKELLIGFQIEVTGYPGKKEGSTSLQAMNSLPGFSLGQFLRVIQQGLETGHYRTN